jgi:YVTN family beta-propeller protein
VREIPIIPLRPPYDSATTSPSDLHFQILGQLEATRGTRALSLGSRKQRALLCVLLLHANEPISRERLIAEIWGETPPKTVNAALNVYLSRVRRLLANGIGEQPLVTQAAGYVLRVPPEQVDARRFETLVEQGRRELAGGDAQRAQATLRRALALWCGPALAEFDFEPFAQDEIARLEELRLIALESRIEADLELGHHDSLIAELEALVAAHPFRESLRAQLMLALYRCGRQAEALETYRRARRALVEELGIEPGPRLQELETAILRHDPQLEAPASVIPEAAEAEPPETLGQQRPRTRPVLVLLGALVLAIAVAALATVYRSFRSSPTPVQLTGDSVAIIDPENDALVGEVPVGGRPTGTAAGAGAAWVANRDDNTLLRIDPESREVVRTIGLGVKPTNVAVSAGTVWILSDWALLRFDPDINKVVARIDLPRRGGLGYRWTHLEVGEHAVWVCSCATLGGALAHIDADTDSIVFMREGPVGVIEYSGGVLWALTGYELGSIEQIDPRTNAVVKVVPRGRIGGAATINPRLIAAGGGDVWFATADALWRMDASTGRFTGSVALGHTPLSVTVGEGAVWVASYDGSLLRIDPSSQTPPETIQLSVRPLENVNAVAVGEGAVWVATTTLAVVAP